jgi:DNA repair exonuclease SbcCD ATPase subunit
MAMSPLSSSRPMLYNPAVRLNATEVIQRPVTAKAVARDGGDPTDFPTPEVYKNFLARCLGYVGAAREGQQAAQQALAAAKEAQQRSEAQYGAPKRAAQAALGTVEAKYQAPLDNLKAQLNAATTALDNAEHPGNGAGAQLDQQSQSFNAEAAQYDSRIAQLRQQKDYLSPQSPNYAYEAQSINREIQALTTQSQALARARFAAAQRGDRARDITVAPDSANVQAAKQKVQDLTDKVEQAMADLRDQTAPFRDKLDDASRTYNHQMTSSRSVVADAKRRLDDAQGQVSAAEARVADLPSQIGSMKKMNWKMFGKFDVEAYTKGELAKLR